MVVRCFILERLRRYLVLVLIVGNEVPGSGVLIETCE